MALGYPTPRHLLRCMTSKELAEWMAYFRIEPFGQDQQDFIMAQVASMTYSANRAKGQSAKGPEEFFMYHPMKPETDPDVIFESLRRTLG